MILFWMSCSFHTLNASVNANVKKKEDTVALSLATPCLMFLEFSVHLEFRVIQAP
jgi:hypothetical protein